MTGVRAPTVAGIGGGVGTTTVAAALHGRDGGRADTADTADTADVLVCRGTLDSLDRAAAVVDRAGPGPRPVLAVTLDGARLPRGPLRERVLLLDEVTSGVVLLPRVRHWRTLADPLAEAATLLVEPAERLPRPLRACAAALRELAAAVADSGRLRGGGRAALREPAGAVADSGRLRGGGRATLREPTAVAADSGRLPGGDPTAPRATAVVAADPLPAEDRWPEAGRLRREGRPAVPVRAVHRPVGRGPGAGASTADASTTGAATTGASTGGAATRDTPPAGTAPRRGVRLVAASPGGARVGATPARGGGPPGGSPTGPAGVPVERVG